MQKFVTIAKYVLHYAETSTNVLCIPDAGDSLEEQNFRRAKFTK